VLIYRLIIDLNKLSGFMGSSKMVQKAAQAQFNHTCTPQTTNHQSFSAVVVHPNCR